MQQSPPASKRAGEGAEEALLQLSATPSSQLKYLGPEFAGSVAGLRVAAFDDLRAHDVSALQKQLGTAEGDIDVLLTPSWPAGVLGAAPSLAGLHKLCLCADSFCIPLL